MFRSKDFQILISYIIIIISRVSRYWHIWYIYIYIYILIDNFIYINIRLHHTNQQTPSCQVMSRCDDQGTGAAIGVETHHAAAKPPLRKAAEQVSGQAPFTTYSRLMKNHQQWGHVCVYVYMYIYIYIEREREREISWWDAISKLYK